MKKKLKLTDKRDAFRPFSYPWAFDAFLQSEQMHWLHTEAPAIVTGKQIGRAHV